MAFREMEHDQTKAIIQVSFGNASNLNVPTNGATATLTQSGSQDLTDYIPIGVTGVTLAAAGLCVRGFSYARKEIYIVNTTGSAVTLAPNYASLTCAFIHK